MSCNNGNNHYNDYWFVVGSAIYFNQTLYSVDENNGPAQPVIALSSLVSVDFTVQLKSNDITAKGKYICM